MPSYGLWSFCIVYAVAVATPGPGIAAVIAQGLTRGSAGAVPFIAGFVVGDLIWFCAAALGLSELAHTAPALFAAVKYAGAAYLLLLAYKAWSTPGQPLITDSPASGEQRISNLFLGSLALTLGNPKAMVFYLALLPTLVPLDRLTAQDILAIAAAIAIILPAVLCGYVLAASRARGLLRSARANRLLNRSSGAVLAAAALAVAAR